MPGTQHRSPLFSDKKRLKTCREARGFSQEELIRIVESLPDNHGKSRSVKHLSYLENETRPMSIEYATLLAQALNVRAEYLLYKDDFPTDTDRIWACAKTQSIRDELMEEVLEAHGYQIKDITDTMPIEIDSEGRQYQCPAVALISPSGSIRKFPDDEFFDFLRQLDDEIEMHAAFQFRMLFDKAKNLYKWKV
ncbi:MAG: helix-turn-helix domain-containing protein [Oscillospiraceae bacterium]